MKENIVQKASTLFIQRGFKSVTMDDLADALAISKKTLYAHFENKEQLVRESSFMFLKVSVMKLNSSKTKQYIL